MGYRLVMVYLCSQAWDKMCECLRTLYHHADIDECDLEADTCHMNAECTNTDGSYMCFCLAGYSGNGFLTCDGTGFQKH